MNFPVVNKKKFTGVNDNVLEALRGIPASVGKTVAQDVIGKTSSDVFASLLGQIPNQANESKYQNENLQQNEQFPRYSAFHPEMNRQKPIKVEEMGLKQKIESVRAELAALSKSITSLNIEVEKAIAEMPVDPGIYHINFYERLRSMLLFIRQNVDNSRSWLSMHTSRKKKMGYWGMYKKHGTTFGLSNERTLATQAG
jgi:hypothetical protein